MPQQVVAYRVPGTGPVEVEFSLANSGTATHFDTLLQVRTKCGIVPADDGAVACFDNADIDEARSRGAVVAEGGDIIYAVIMGTPQPQPDDVNQGPWRLEVFATAASSPTSQRSKMADTPSSTAKPRRSPNPGVRGADQG